MTTEPLTDHPGLDAGAVAALLPSRARREESALTLLKEHFTRQPDGYVAWSGGKDSTAALHLALRLMPDVPVVWFDSGLEYPETRSYVELLSQQWELNLHIIKAEPDALTMLQRSGGWHHGDTATGGDDFHDALIAAPARQAHARFGPGEVSGLRSSESVGRRILLAKGQGRYERKDGTVVVAPVWRWRDIDIESYLASNGIPPNPVYAKLVSLGAPPYAQRVGLVVDYNGAEAGRFTWLRVGWPDLWRELAETLPRLKEWR